MEQLMKIRCYWPFLAALAFATAPIIVLNDAHAGPSMPNARPDVGISALAPASPSDTRMPTSLAPFSPTSVPFEGGPRETLAECMANWDAGTHMSTDEWRRACQRTLDGTSF
jgi:hypothetical protein